MTRELLIMRHAKSDWSTAGQLDFDRVLAKRGRRACKQMGIWLREQDLTPDLIVCSTAQRARDTVTRLCRFAQIPEAIIVWEPRIYEADLQTLLAMLGEMPADVARTMLVGHNPGLDYLVRYLSDDSLAAWEAGNLMPTATIARLDMPDNWVTLRPGTAETRSVSRPRELFGE